MTNLNFPTDCQLSFINTITEELEDAFSSFFHNTQEASSLRETTAIELLVHWESTGAPTQRRATKLSINDKIDLEDAIDKLLVDFEYYNSSASEIPLQPVSYTIRLVHITTFTATTHLQPLGDN